MSDAPQPRIGKFAGVGRVAKLTARARKRLPAAKAKARAATPKVPSVGTGLINR